MNTDGQCGGLKFKDANKCFLYRYLVTWILTAGRNRNGKLLKHSEYWVSVIIYYNVLRVVGKKKKQIGKNTKAYHVWLISDIFVIELVKYY